MSVVDVLVVCYFAIGLFYLGTIMPAVAKSVAGRHREEDKTIVSVCALIVALLFAPLWPLFVGASLARKIKG